MKTLKDYEYYRTDKGVLYCGDCLEILPLFDACSVDLVLTDPPYGVGYLSNRTKNHKKIINDGFDEWLNSISGWLSAFQRACKKEACCCCFCGGGGGKTPATALFTIEAIKHFNLIQTVVWEKNLGLGWKYRPRYENVVVLSKSKDNYNWFDTSKKAGNVIEGINQQVPKKGDHPTQKPVELMELFLHYHTQKGMLVLEPFAGGGSTLIACERLNRRWIGIEISEEYCEIAKRRLEKETEQIKLFEE